MISFIWVFMALAIGLALGLESARLDYKSIPPENPYYMAWAVVLCAVSAGIGTIMGLAGF